MNFIKENLSKYRVFVIVELFIVSTLPILLFLFNIVPLTRTNMLLVLSSVFIVVFLVTTLRILFGHWNLKELGFNHITKEALEGHLGLLLLGVLALWLFQSFFEKEGPNILLSWQRMLGFSIIGSFFQEFLYRSYLIRLSLDVFKNEFSGRMFIIAVINIVLFVFMHSIFIDWQVVVPLTFFGGMIFTLLYIRYKSLILVSIVHMLLNYAALSFGFFAL